MEKDIKTGLVDVLSTPEVTFLLQLPVMVQLRSGISSTVAALKLSTSMDSPSGKSLSTTQVISCCLALWITLLKCGI